MVLTYQPKIGYLCGMNNYSDRLIDLAKNANDKKSMIKLSLKKDYRKELEDATKFLDASWGKVPLKMRCLTILANYTEESFPKCPNCESLVGYRKEKIDGFNTFCSDKCSKEFGRLPIETKEKLNSYDWLFEHRITKRLSFESMGMLVGTSEIPPSRACKKFKIPEVNYTESDASIKAQMYDKEKMTELYDSGMPHREIADIVGVSPATISVAFKKMGIEPKAPNSYDRKFNKRSIGEMELETFVQSLGITTKNSVRTILNGLEIDIFCPVKMIGFEYNGLFSHNDTQKDKNYHLRKTEEAAKKGVKLFHIFEDDWEFKKDIVKSIIASKLGVSDRKIFARKCSIKEINSGQKAEFLTSNHIQGNDKSKFFFGLECDDELVAVMTFGSSRYNKGYKWELMRFATKKMVRVVGGFTKLLEAFRKLHDGNIISYADRTISDGGVYANNGFTLIRTNPPGYYYIPKNKRFKLHRSNFRKDKISDIPDDPRSETEIMIDLGYTRIWDCGTYAFGIE